MVGLLGVGEPVDVFGFDGVHYEGLHAGVVRDPLVPDVCQVKQIVPDVVSDRYVVVKALGVVHFFNGIPTQATNEADVFRIVSFFHVLVPEGGEGVDDET